MFLLDPRDPEPEGLVHWDSLADWVAAGGDLEALEAEAGQHRDWVMLASIELHRNPRPCELCEDAVLPGDVPEPAVVVEELEDEDGRTVAVCPQCSECIEENRLEAAREAAIRIMFECSACGWKIRPGDPDCANPRCSG